MRKTGSLCFILILLSSFCYSQTDSAQWVLDKFLEASGGRALWDSTVSVRMHGVQTAHNGGYTGNAESVSRFFTNTSFLNGDAYHKKTDTVKTTIFCFRQDVSYMHILRKHDTIHDETVGEAKEQIRKANGNFATQHSIINQDTVFQKASYGGVYRSGEQAWWLVIFNRDGREATWFVNTQTHLLDRIESSWGSVILLSGYKTIQGRHQPTHLLTKKKGKIIYDMRITDIQYNVALPICTLPHDGGQ